MLFNLFAHWRNSYTGIPIRIWFLSMVSLVNRCGSMVVVFLSIYLTQHLGYGIEEAGYILGCFGAGALLGGFLSLVVPENFVLFGKSWHWTSSLWGVLVVSSLARGVVALTLAPALREVREVRKLTPAGLMLRVVRFNALGELIFDMLAFTRRRLRTTGQS